MNDKRRVLCPANQGLADYVFEKKQEHADKPKGLSENMERTFVKAYRNVCDAKEPINTLKDLSQIKYVSCFLFSSLWFLGNVVSLVFWVSHFLLEVPLFIFMEKMRPL